MVSTLYNNLNKTPLIISFAAGTTISMLCVFGVLLAGVPIEIWGEAGKYTVPAKDWLAHGNYVFYSHITGNYEAYFGRLPVFPGFIAIVYYLFGNDNYLAVALAQCVVFGLTAFMVALAAKALNPKWTLAAGLLTSVWPNLLFRPATIMPETLFTFEVSCILCGLLWLLHADTPSNRKRLIQIVTATGVAMGLALMTRPSFLAFPFLVLPFFVTFYIITHRATLKSAAIIAASIVVIMVSFTIPQFLRSYQAYGTLMFTSESGFNYSSWMYPCLKTPWGCGERDREALAQVTQRLEEEVYALTPEQQSNLPYVNQIKKKIGFEMIGALPKFDIVRAYVGAQVKLWLHNSFYQIKERFKLPGEDLMLSHIAKMDGNFFVNYVKQLQYAPWMFMWLLFESVLMLSRLLQVNAVVGAFKIPNNRYQTLLLAICAIALTATAIGLGNPRYRVPAEPALVLLTIAGFVRAWPMLQHVMRRVWRRDHTHLPA